MVLPFESSNLWDFRIFETEDRSGISSFLADSICSMNLAIELLRMLSKPALMGLEASVVEPGRATVDDEDDVDEDDDDDDVVAVGAMDERNEEMVDMDESTDDGCVAAEAELVLTDSGRKVAVALPSSRDL